MAGQRVAAVPLSEAALDVQHIHTLSILIRAAHAKDKAVNSRTELLRTLRREQGKR